MAVITGTELFVNAAWTEAKHPAKSPFGVELVWGENAFATLDEAIARAEAQSLTDVQYIVGDKQVTVNDATGALGFIAATEIKGTETAKPAKTGVTFTAQTKQSVANKITFDNSGAAPGTTATLAGFKEVVLNGGSAAVLGGANTLTHIHAADATAKGNTVKDSATVTGKADGVLTVNGARLAAGTGAWAEVKSEYGDQITSTTTAFQFAHPGDPDSPLWGYVEYSMFDNLPGYATVTLTSGALAEALTGGNLNFTRVTDATYSSGTLLSLTKSASASAKAAGKLTLDNAGVGMATFYSTVGLKGDIGFSELVGGTLCGNDKTTYQYTSGARNATIKTTSSGTGEFGAAGSLDINGRITGGYLHNVSGYAKVTIGTAGDGTQFGTFDAQNSKESVSSTTERVTTPLAGGSSSVKSTTTEIASTTYTAGGTLATAKGAGAVNFWTINGFNKVDLVNATVSNGIRTVNSNSYYSDAATLVDGVLTQSKWSEKYSDAATGTLSLSGGVVSTGIYGFATVKITGAHLDVSGIEGDKKTYNEMWSSDTASDAKTGIVTSTYVYSDNFTCTAAGALTFVNASFGGYYTPHLEGYAAVTFDRADGSISWIAGNNQGESYSSKKTQLQSGGGPTTTALLDVKYVSSRTATGTLTATGGTGGLAFGSINGFSKVSLTGMAVNNDVYASTAKTTESTFVSRNTRTGALASAYQSSGSAKLAGNATLVNVSGAFTGGVKGYQTVTLDGTTVGGKINDPVFYTDVNYSCRNDFSDDGVTLAKQAYQSGSALAATGALTLKNGAQVAGSAGGLKTLTIGAGCAVGGNAAMYARKVAETDNIASKNGVYEEKYQRTTSRTAAGTVTVTSGGTAASIECAAKVTATDAVINGAVVGSASVGSTAITAKGAKVVSSAGDSRYKVDAATATMYASTGSSCASAAGAATLTDTIVTGGISGCAAVKLTDVEVKGVFGWNYIDSWTYSYDKGVLDYRRNSRGFAAGTLTAVRTTFTGDLSTIVGGFAMVNLTDCEFLHSGMIYGGSYGLVASGTGTGANYAAASAALVSSSVKSFAAAGTLTATNSLLGGIQNLATVKLTDCAAGNIVVDSGSTVKTALTLAGNNTIGGVGMYSIQNVNDISVKSGVTTVKKSFLGTDGNDTVTVAAKSELVVSEVVNFSGGSDSLTVNGTFRAGGWFNAESLEKLSGSGLLALNDTSAKYVIDEIAAGNIKLSGKLEIVAAGSMLGDVLAVRTKKEELADNEVSGARKFDGEDMAGWLCGIEDAARGMFADTEDWISFHNCEDDIFEVGLTDVDRHDQIGVELWQGGVKLQDVAWDNMTESFTVCGLAAGDYQLRLTTGAVTNGLSYNFGVAALS